MKFNVDQMHLTENEILARKSEISELQKALSDSHLAIYDEKNTVNGLKLQYEGLLKAENADVRRIAELQALNDDVKNQSMTVGGPVTFKDCRTDKSQPLGPREKALQKSSDKKENKSKLANLNMTQASAGVLSGSTANQTGVNQTQRSKASRHNTSVQANGTTGGIVKTVLLPYDEIINLKHELEYLKQYKISQKSLFEEAIQGYQKDKMIRL